MKLSKRTRYAVRFMYELALHYGKGIMNLNAVAEKEDISMKYLSQIVIPLKNSGLIIASRGPNGGYSLAKKPDNITIHDIVNVLEGDIHLVECLINKTICKRTPICPSRDIWDGLSKAIKEYLASITVKDLIDGVSRYFENSINYQI